MKKTAKWIAVALAACAIALAGCKVVSEPEPVAVESVTLDATTLTLAPGDTRKLTATVKPENADDKIVKWSSSDTSVVMVDSDGTVVAIKVGTAAITAQAGGKTAICAVNVRTILNPVENITLDRTTLTLLRGDKYGLRATVTPDNADDTTVLWSSSDTTVATVVYSGDFVGEVTAVNAGTATITAQMGDKTAICVVIVKEGAATNPDSPVVNPDSPVAVEGVTLNAETLIIEPGKTRTLTAKVTPNNADDKTVTWSSSDTSVATVDDGGTITAHAEGSATITAQASGFTATCLVTVKPIQNPVENITLSETMLTLTLTLTHGETKILKATVTPDNADDKTVLWWSYDPNVATVNNDGKVTAVNVGATTIYAQAGYEMAGCTVNVEPKPIESLTLDKDTLVLTCGKKYKLNATITPNDAYYESVRWGASGWSYNESPVVGVNYEDGTVTALREGTATVYVIVDGVKTAECKVTVIPAPIDVESVSLNCETLTLTRGKTSSLRATVTPSNADDTTVTWSSSDTSVATVDNNNFGYATITALKEGTVTITAQAGGKKATCVVTVTSPFVIEGGVLTKYAGVDSTVTIPAGVTQIGSEAFKGCTSLTTVTIPAGVTSIGDSAFKKCTSLTTVNISADVASIASGAFDGCDNIKTVKYGGTLTQWCSVQNDWGLMYYASSVVLGDEKDLKTLTKLEIPDDVQYIGKYAFSHCTALESVFIPDSVTDIGEDAFFSCTGLKTVNIPKNVSSIEYSVFQRCKSLASVTIPDGVTSIRDAAFAGCESLTNVTIPASVKSIGNSAFAGCTGFTEITIPDGVTIIESAAFMDCSNLTVVTIPASVEHMMGEPFRNCTKLTRVNYGGTKSQWEQGGFRPCFRNGTQVYGKDATWTVVIL